MLIINFHAAPNAVGVQVLDLELSADDENLLIRAVGRLDGEDFQIDFDALEPEETDRLIESLQFIRKRMKPD